MGKLSTCLVQLGLGPLNLWTNVCKMADEAADVRELLIWPEPSNCETLARSLIDSTQKIVKKQASALSSLNTAKAEHVGQVKPLESILDDMTLDLCSPSGSHDKDSMGGTSSSGPGSCQQLQNQVKLLSGRLMSALTSECAFSAIMRTSRLFLRFPRLGSTLVKICDRF